ncbi:MAG: type II secretion system inner membrane protein GspF [Pseudomonadota bacterium]
MPAFEYEATDLGGKIRRGVLTAETTRQARSELRRRNLTPIAVQAPRQTQASAGARERHISEGDLVAITRQLQVLAAAHTPLDEALNAVAMQTDQQHVRRLLLSVRERVLEGWRLSDAMGEHPKSFSGLYRAVVAAGETSGDMGAVLDRLATMLEKNRAMRNAALASLIYPAVLAVVAGGVVTLLLTFVVPKIVENFRSFNAELPLITQAVVGFSDFLSVYGLVLLAIICVVSVGFRQLRKAQGPRLAIDKFVLKLPVVGKLSRALEGARFARTLSTLFAGGAPLLDSLIGAQRTISNAHIRSELDQTITLVREGTGLAVALKRPGVLPSMMVHMVAAGERAGEVPMLLDKAAAQLEDEFETATSVALRLLEPAIIVAMGGAVLTIVMAIMLPIMRLNALANG